MLPFGVTDPFGAEIANLHHRQAAFAGKAIDEEGFANADAARQENAAIIDRRRIYAFLGRLLGRERDAHNVCLFLAVGRNAAR